MRHTATILLSLSLLLFLAGDASARKLKYSHQEYFEHYEGTSTCLECHQEEAESFFHSQHYQWQGEAPAIVNADGRKLGKLNTINDFCTNPMASWIGNAVNSDGKIIAQGCSKCHAGLGKKPSPQLSREQLENIDCLICHASGYRRDAYQDAQGNWEWKPILWKNQRGMDSVSKRITLPRRKMCLRCHSGAGGGPNYKRGDIEYKLAECDAGYDVHMGTDGQDMACMDCHGDQDHRVIGRGSDLAATDSPGKALLCTNCHDQEPHGIAALDRHVAKVYCTVCHIPTFARTDRTDMVRDWSTPLYHEEANKYSATITFGQDVVPHYAWFNGETEIALMGDELRPDEDGVITVMAPQGKRKDRKSRIHAFKWHRAKLPYLRDRKFLSPLAVDEFFVDGDIEKAVVEGAAAAYGIHHPDYEWVDVQRFMGIYHGVVPADQALQCLDCHREGGRMDWQALGYKKDPLLDAMD